MKKNSNAFVVGDPNKCIGCKACEMACFAAHNSVNEVGYTVGTIEVPVVPRLFLVQEEGLSVPVQCRHCEDAPCANVCPEGAIKEVAGKIVVMEDKCVGCKTCLLACPIGALELSPQFKKKTIVKQLNLKDEAQEIGTICDKYIVYKCDLCQDLSEKACIAACPKDALRLYDPKDDRKAKNRKAALGLLSTVK